MAPSSGRSPATLGAITRFSGTLAVSLRRSSTMGVRGLMSWARSASLTSHTWRRALRSANITASGLVGRCLRSRSCRTASSLRASQARWKPPRPLTATMPPSWSICAARAMMSSDDARSLPRSTHPGSSAVRQVSCGPQAKHASGWAWKRLSAGSAYSWAHAGHIAKPAMDVRGRS